MSRTHRRVRLGVLIVLIAPGLYAMQAAFPASLVSQQASGSVQLAGTALRVQLPAGWKLEPPRQPPQQHLLTTTSDPRYELWVSQTTPQSFGHSCMGLIGSMQTLPRLNSSIESRPAFVPDIYMGSILSMADVQLVCLSTGDKEVGVMIQARGGSSKPEVLTPMLAAIADAAVKLSAAVSSPGRVKLPLLGIEIALRDGAWGVRETTDFWGRNNVLGRAAKPGRNELNITPFFMLPGRCENLGSASPSGITTATFVKERRYGGERWYPGAWEQFPPPFKGLVAYACRNVGANSILLARIEYEKTTVPEADLTVIRQMLDEIGNATEGRGASLPGAPPVTNQGRASQSSPPDIPVVLSDTQGVDFAPYIRTVMNRIRLNWLAVIQPAAIQGATGRVDATFAITREGTITDVRLIVPSGNSTLDKAVTTAIELSNPLPALPADFKGDRLTLRLPFVYTLPAGQRE